jgi:hypothetical protein
VVDAAFRFSGQQLGDQAVLFGQIYVERTPRDTVPSPAPPEASRQLQARLRDLVGQALDGRWQGVAPRISISVLDP